MIATEAGVDSIDVLETIGEPRGRQIIRSKPPADIGERSDDRRKRDADQCESCQRAGLAKALPRSSCCGSGDVRHLQLPSKRIHTSTDVMARAPVMAPFGCGVAPRDLYGKNAIGVS